jgi:putative peptide zinc metalloprotease protein
VLVIAGKYFVFGVLLAIWSVIGALVLPVAKGLYFLFFSPRLRKSRTRAVATMAVLIASVTAAIFLVPAPMWTRAEGIIWVPEDAIVRPGTEGFVSKVMALPNSMVKAGDAIVRLDEPLLDSQIRVLKARVAQLEAQYYSEQFEQKVRAEITKEALGSAQAELTRALERSKSLDVRAPADGRLVIARADDLPARFVRQGQELAYIVDGGRITVRVVVPQQDIDLVRNRSRSVEVRLVENSGESMPAVVLREVPAASSSLPNLALSVEGGGSVALDPRERNKPLALQKYFQFELELPRLSNAHIGSRVFVRFDHGGEPLGRQWYRRLRQVFLKQLNV